MFVSLKVGDLKNALKRAQKVTQSRNSIPILECVKMVADGSSLTITSTDMDCEFSDKIEVDKARFGQCAVSLRRVSGLVDSFDNTDTIELEVKDNALAYSVAGSVAVSGSLALQHYEDFPELSDLPSKGKLFNVDHIRAMFGSTLHCVSKEETRYYLNGVYVEYKDEKLNSVATDGHRLAVCWPENIDLSNDEVKGEFEAGVIIPKKAVSLLLSILPKDESNEGVFFFLSETRARFTVGDISITTKLIDGTFPDWRRVACYGSDMSPVKIDRLKLRRVAKIIKKLSNERLASVRLSGEAASIDISNTDRDNFLTARIPGLVETEFKDFGLNADYVVDMASHFTGDNIEFGYIDNSSPIRAEEKRPECEFHYVLMPMRV